MSEFFGIKTEKYGIVPVDEDGEEIMKKLKIGEPYMVKVWKPKNIKFHRKFFALLNVLFNMQEFYDNKKAFRYWLTMKAGYFKMYLSPKGKPMYFADSIAFDKMDETKFGELYQKVIDTAIGNDKICGGSTYDEINGKVEEILNFA